MGRRYVGKNFLPHYWVLHVKGLDGFFHQVLFIKAGFCCALNWSPNGQREYKHTAFIFACALRPNFPPVRFDEVFGNRQPDT